MVTFNTSSSFRLNPSRRYLGVEIEIAYINDENMLEAKAQEWKGDLGEDGSVGGSRSRYKDRQPTSLELRTAPTNGDLFVRQMLDFGKTFKKAKAATNNTCGLHVHIDARDLKEKHLENVIALWGKIEEPMFSIISPRRAKADWCKPWDFKVYRDAEKLKKQVVKNREYDYEDGDHDGTWYRTGCESSMECDCCTCDDCGVIHNRVTKPGAKKAKAEKMELLKRLRGGYSLGRYRSLNMDSLADLGTLENRMHHGTTNVVNIINWGILNASMVDYAKSESLSKIVSLTKGFPALMEIAPNKTVKEWIKDRKDNWSKVRSTSSKAQNDAE